MADWSELTKDVLELITSKLELSDYHRFSVVCRNWHAAAKAKRYQPANQLPWLVLGEDRETKKRVFFSLSEKKHHYIDIPELYGHICLGSSYGWLFTIDEEIDGHLLNPLTREHFKLPPFPSYRKGRTIEDAKALEGNKRYRMQSNIVLKAILSNNPSEVQDFTLVILFGLPSTVVFWRPGDPTWSVVKNSYGLIQDATYFNGTLFALVGCFYPLVVELGSDPKMVMIHPFVRRKHWCKEAYLVNFDGECLLLVQRIEAEDKEFRDLDEMEEEELQVLLERHRNGDYGDDEHRHFVTKELCVFEIDLEEGTFCKWDDIDGSTVFLGRGSHVVVDPTQVRGCVPDRISYSGIVNEYNGFDNVGFYDMVSNTVGEYNPCKRFIRHAVSPAWFTPNPW